MLANGLHRIRWRRVAVTRVHRTHRKSVRERLSKYTSKSQSGVVAWVENVGKRTPSDPMETGCREKSPSDSPQVCSRET